MSIVGEKEIGSEFWSVPQGRPGQFDRLLGFGSSNLTLFQSGRSALGAVLDNAIKYDGVETIAFPSYCCESMVAPACDRDLRVSYYPVLAETGGGISCDVESVSADAVVVLDYFGFRDPSLAYLETSDKILIRDVTHGLLSEGISYDADYCFGSLRKWAGFLTGGIAWSEGSSLAPCCEREDNDAYSSLRQEAMGQKERFISGLSSERGYLDMFARAEGMLSSSSPIEGCVDDARRLMSLDVAEIAHRRRENYNRLFSRLRGHAIFSEADERTTPLFFPILVAAESRTELRNSLVANRVFCPIHWPAFDSCAQELSPELYACELSLVCDQRYDRDDMDRISDLVLSCLGE